MTGKALNAIAAIPAPATMIAPRFLIPRRVIIF